jgi:hypothetical protein
MIIERIALLDAWVQGNAVGPAMRGDGCNYTNYGIEIEPGASDRYVVTGNKLAGNLKGGVMDGAKGGNAVVANNVV